MAFVCPACCQFLSILYTHGRRASNFDHAQSGSTAYTRWTVAGLLVRSQRQGRRRRGSRLTRCLRPVLAWRRCDSCGEMIGWFFVGSASRGREGFRWKRSTASDLSKKRAEHSSHSGELSGRADACCSVNRVDGRQRAQVHKSRFLGVILCECLTESRQAVPLPRSF